MHQGNIPILQIHIVWSVYLSITLELYYNSLHTVQLAYKRVKLISKLRLFVILQVFFRVLIYSHSSQGCLISSWIWLFVNLQASTLLCNIITFSTFVQFFHEQCWCESSTFFSKWQHIQTDHRETGIPVIVLTFQFQIFYFFLGYQQLPRSKTTVFKIW